VDFISPEAEEHFEIWPENWATLLVFLALETQWRKEITMTGHLVWHGLRYGEVETTIRLLGHQSDRRLIFKGVTEMERAALPLLNKPRK
jgi:hypothetical protein